MAHRSVIPFGPQHPVLPEPLHLDLVIEDDRVIEAIPQIGFVHRGLEKLTEKRDMHQFGYIAERICGICAVGHSCGYASACERMLGIEVPGRVQYIRTILHELSRIHSHLLWLGLLADAFGFEALFYRSWTLREQILKIFESTCGGRVILSINEIGGLKHDIEDSELAGIVQTLDAMRPDYEALVHTFLDDDSCGERLHGVGVISKKDALELSMVGPFGRASGVDYDVRAFGDGAYADLAAFEPIVATDGDCYARCQVRCAEVTQAMDIIKELVGKIPQDGIGGRTKLTPADGARGEVVIEQPRGEAYYYVRGNGTKNLDRFRVRTPTSQNLAGLTHALQGVLLANVPMIILTIDMFAYKAMQQAGSMIASMAGVDTITFTAGIGENDWSIRKAFCDCFEWLGVRIDNNKNREAVGNGPQVISAAGSAVTVMVIPTDEEYMIAHDVERLTKSN